MASTGVCSPAQNWRLKLASDGAPELERLVDWRREQFRDAIKFFRASLAVLRALPAGIILGSTSILSAIKIQLHSELFGCLKGPQSAPPSIGSLGARSSAGHTETRYALLLSKYF